MKVFTRLVAPLLGAVLFAGCANQKDTDTAPVAIDEVCIISGEPVDADSPSVDYMGQTVRFCCTRCKSKFEGMDDAGKKAAMASRED